MRSGDVPEAVPAEDAHVQVEHLQVDECWRLLQAASVARLAFIDANGDPEVYPVNILTDRGMILVRTAEDAKTRALAARPRVAVEIDGGPLRAQWSVIAHATAEVIADDTDAHPRASVRNFSWFPGVKTHMIRLTVGSITGRRFLVVAGARTSTPRDDSTPRPRANPSHRGERPTAIPSRPPLDESSPRLM